MADGNAFANDGSFMARFLVSQQREKDEAGGHEGTAAGAVGAAAIDERVRESVAKNDGSFLSAFLALQREKERRGDEPRVAEDEAIAEKEKAPASADPAGRDKDSAKSKDDSISTGNADGGGRPARKKRSRWDAGPAVGGSSADGKKEERKTPAGEDEDEALRSVHAKQQKHREELRFLEQRIRGFQQQAVSSTAAAQAKKEAEVALAEERRREYARLAELAERERDYRDTVEQAELGVVRDGTREHRQRAQEMLQTLETAAAATERAEGKHHLGDFLPKEELERIMQHGRPKALAGGTTAATSESDETSEAQADNDEFDQYRKRMMLAYRFRPNPLNNPRRPYY